MKMGHGFASVPAVIDDETISLLRQADEFRHLGRLEEEMAQEALIGGPGLGNSRKGFLRHE